MLTDDELMRLPRDGYKREYVDGEIRLSPAGYRHGRISVRLVVRLSAYVSERGLGEVLESSTGFRLPNQNLRLPDVSFVAAERVPAEEASVGFFQGAPDLAVEVLSPSDRPKQVLDRIGDYLEAGTRLVWVIDPERRQAVVHRSLVDARTVEAELLGA
jgi:Uma2 family endonuclease